MLRTCGDTQGDPTIPAALPVLGSFVAAETTKSSRDSHRGVGVREAASAASLLDLSGATALDRWSLTANAARGSLGCAVEHRSRSRVTHSSPASPPAISTSSQPGARASRSTGSARRRATAASSAFATQQGVDRRSTADPPRGGFGSATSASASGAASSAPTRAGARKHSLGPCTALEAGVRCEAKPRRRGPTRGCGPRARRDACARTACASRAWDSSSTTRCNSRAACEPTAGIRLDHYRFGVSSDATAAGQIRGSAVRAAFLPDRAPVAGPELFAGCRAACGRRHAHARRRLRSAHRRTPRQARPVRVLRHDRSRPAHADLRRGNEALGLARDGGCGAHPLAGGSVACTGAPTRRDAVQATLALPARSLASLDLDAALVRARFADGAGEAIPGAARSYAAGATLRRPRLEREPLRDLLRAAPGVDDPSARARRVVRERAHHAPADEDRRASASTSSTSSTSAWATSTISRRRACGAIRARPTTSSSTPASRAACASGCVRRSEPRAARL